MTKDDVRGALKALPRADPHIVAILDHMTHEEPQYTGDY